MRESTSHFSLKRMTVALLAVVVVLTWVAMANAYFASSEGAGLRYRISRRPGRTSLIESGIVLGVNGCRGLIDVPSVVSFTFRERLAIPLGGAIAVASVLSFSAFARYVEKTIDAPFAKRPKR